MGFNSLQNQLELSPLINFKTYFKFKTIYENRSYFNEILLFENLTIDIQSCKLLTAYKFKIPVYNSFRYSKYLYAGIG